MMKMYMVCGCVCETVRSRGSELHIKMPRHFAADDVMKVTFGNKLLMGMTTNEVEQEICKLLKLNALPETEDVIKSCICNCLTSTGCCTFRIVSKKNEL